MARISEAAINSQLATALAELNPKWASGQLLVESNHVFQENVRLRPDIILRAPHSQPVVLETEFAPARNVEAEAKDRLGLTVAASGESVDQAIALSIPASLQQDQRDLAKRIKTAAYHYCVYSQYEVFPSRWPENGWLEGNLYDVARCIEQLMVSERIVDASLKVLESAVRAASMRITDETQTGFPDLERDLGRVLNQMPGEQTTRMAMTIMANALCFHAALAGQYDIPSLERLLEDRETPLQHAVVTTWRRILEDINYWPVFKVARDLLIPLKNRAANRILRILIGSARTFEDLGINSRHDLVGKMFQRLIIDRKFLATFYTRPTSSVLLAELAMNRMSHDWQDLESYPDLRVADLACGTGTLLSAAYHAILMRYRHAGGDDADVHKSMIEQAMIAADIMPAAVHLCASQLSSVHPAILFENTCVYTMPYGYRETEASGIALGSLSLLQTDSVLSLFATGDHQVAGTMESGEATQFALPDQSLDLVIMNPPFTRPTNHKKTEVPVPSFAGFNKSEEEQRAMSQELKKIYRKLPGAAGNGNAGLASRFVDLAHVKVKPGGVVAFVLPFTVLRGRAWQATRDLWSTKYKDVVAVTVATVNSRDRAFSADTDMAETLIVATRLENGSEQLAQHILYVNLLRRPKSLLEATEVARLCRALPGDSHVGTLRTGEDVLGTYIRASMNESGCAALRSTSLADLMLSLVQGRLQMARYRRVHDLPMTRLNSLGQRGLVHRDIYSSLETSAPYRGPFEIGPLGDAPNYPSLWSHQASRERQMRVLPDTEGRPRSGCEDKAVTVWQTASRLHFSLDFGLSSQSLAACMTPTPTIGGRAWPNFTTEELDWSPLLCLWANSTLGLMAFWWEGSRQHPGRALLTITSLPALLMIDPQALTQSKIIQAAKLFEHYQSQELLPANEAYRDPVRQAIDRSLLVDLLELPYDILDPLDQVRLQWCSEPTVHGGKRTRPAQSS